MADATDLKSVDPKGSCGFESRHRYLLILALGLRRTQAVLAPIWPKAEFALYRATQKGANKRRSPKMATERAAAQLCLLPPGEVSRRATNSEHPEPDPRLTLLFR